VHTLVTQTFVGLTSKSTSSNSVEKTRQKVQQDNTCVIWLVLTDTNFRELHIILVKGTSAAICNEVLKLRLIMLFFRCCVFSLFVLKFVFVRFHIYMSCFLYDFFFCHLKVS
jgi:hypothetical protein